MSLLAGHLRFPINEMSGLRTCSESKRADVCMMYERNTVVWNLACVLRSRSVAEPGPAESGPEWIRILGTTHAPTSIVKEDDC